MNGRSSEFTKVAWHVVYSKPKQEFRALQHLENQGYDCFLPTLRDDNVIGPEKRIGGQPLFSRYLFVRLDPMSGKWSAIRSTRGVSGLVKFGERFATLPDALVDALKDSPRALSADAFQSGERVAIKGGPFGGLEGVYHAADGRARAYILIEMLSQSQRLSFPNEQVQRATGM
jgi:transcriptional antiterminator RfaH